MDEDQRVATLILQGCRYYRPTDRDQARNSQGVRYLARPGCPIVMEWRTIYSGPNKGQWKWKRVDGLLVAIQVEIPWEPEVIGQFDKSLFNWFINQLNTR